MKVLNREFLTWLFLSAPFFAITALFPSNPLRFVAPVILLAVIILALKKHAVSTHVALTGYLLLIFFLFADAALLFFQGKTFDASVFDLTTIDSLLIGLENYPSFSFAFLLLFSHFSVCAWVTLNRLRPRQNASGKNRLIFSLIVILLVCLAPSSFSFFSNKWIAYQIYKNGLKDNLYFPQTDLISTAGNNLLLIYLESFESEFAQSEYFPELTPFLQDLKTSSISFDAHYMIEGADYSMSSMFASQCGVPTNYVDTHGLVCLGDILNSAGYRQVFMQASDMKFENMGDHYLLHGYDELYGKNELTPIEDEKNQNYWGITDQDLFKYAYDTFLNLNKGYLENAKPFNLTLFTSDTHDGVPSTICPEYKGLFEENHFFQSYHCTDYLLNKFIAKIRTHPGMENLTIAIIGDHLQHFDMYASKLNSMDRRVLAMINTPYGNEGIKITRPTSHVDLTPTLLPLMGVDTNAKFLMGTNAFDPAQSNISSIPLVSGERKKHLYEMVNADTWLETLGVNKKKKIQDLYSYGAAIKNISKTEIEKYLLPDIDNFQNYSTNDEAIYFSMEDNILFLKTDRLFDTVSLHLVTQNNEFFKGTISQTNAIRVTDDWYVWEFGNHFQNVMDLRLSVNSIAASKLYPFPIAIHTINQNTNVSGSAPVMVVRFNNINPEGGEKVGINLQFDGALENAKFYISDLYANRSFTDRVRYQVIYRDEAIFTGDVGDERGVEKQLVNIDLVPDDKIVTILLEAHEQIEDDWEWGPESKIRIEFFQ